MQAAIQLLAFEEPDLSETMDAWAAQRVPDWLDVSYEAWITPSDGRHRTVEQAQEHHAFEYREAPQYKLPSRNAAHESAVSDARDVFISCDADAPPLTHGVLSELCGHFSDTSVAAVCANPVADKSPLGIYSNAGVYAKEMIGGIHGQSHAVSAEAWQHAGPFKVDGIDHTALKEVWMEEERDFGRRLREYGDVRYEYDAPVKNDIRRRECTFRERIPGLVPDGRFCGRPGTDTFAPRKPF